jgi:orotidine-5'-phosphate decarboxylase
MKSSHPDPRPEPQIPVYLAIDTADLDRARASVAVAAEVGFGVKIGKEFFTAYGPQGVIAVAPPNTSGAVPLFLDLKWHDIPNTVAGAISAATQSLRPNMVTVHAAGGSAMIRAARAAARVAAGATGHPPLLLAVTVLTSLDQDDLAAIGVTGAVADQAQRLARLAASAGADGVIASGGEVAGLRQLMGPKFLLVVPGIRLAGEAPGDQKRAMTPEAALAAGADYLVIGRPITQAPDPLAAARTLAAAIA